MTVTIHEQYESRAYVPNESATLSYYIRGTDDETEAQAALDAEAPSTFNGLLLQRPGVKPVHIIEGNDAACIWSGTAPYSPRPLIDTPQTGESMTNFNTGGGTKHLTQSIRTVASFAREGETPPDFGGAIGYDGERIAGIDVVDPRYEFSETHYISSGQVNSYIYFLLTGKVNSNTFRGFNPGECLFMGASGGRRGQYGDWEITFNFSGSLRRENIEIGDIAGISKEGWEYLWALHEDDIDTTANAVIRPTSAIFVEQVYESADFGQLGIG